MTYQQLQDFITTTLVLGFLLGLLAVIIGLPIYAIHQAEAQEAYLESVYERIN